ncbi:hypothetical protein SEVIR_2G042550v4 [Setaria viridis]
MPRPGSRSAPGPPSPRTETTLSHFAEPSSASLPSPTRSSRAMSSPGGGSGRRASTLPPYYRAPGGGRRSSSSNTAAVSSRACTTPPLLAHFLEPGPQPSELLGESATAHGPGREIHGLVREPPEPAGWRFRLRPRLLAPRAAEEPVDAVLDVEEQVPELPRALLEMRIPALRLRRRLQGTVQLLELVSEEHDVLLSSSLQFAVFLLQQGGELW